VEFQDTGIIGTDVSFYQDNDETPQKINFVKMKSYGVSFTVIKAGQDYYPDPDFVDNWRNAKAAGIPRSAYWFCDKDSSGISQAQKFYEILNGDYGEGILFADYETGSWTDWNELLSFISELKRKTGLPDERIGIYTGYPYWIENGPKTAAQKMLFRNHPLWLAWYTLNPDNVKVPDTWTSCLIWQDGTPAIGTQVGVESLEVDHNRFNGDAAKFRAIFGTDPVTTEIGEGMFIYRTKATATPYANLRATPNGADIGDVPPNTELRVDVIEKDSLGRDWVHSVSSAYTGYVLASLCDFIGTETPTAKPVVTVTLQAEGYPTVTYEWKPNA
jgi:GH25 family lysozyme M1 (1,4-beta-N-acetylmuramidase)